MNFDVFSDVLNLISGETQERERVLAYFSNRYVECNPGIFGSQDSVRTHCL